MMIARFPLPIADQAFRKVTGNAFSIGSGGARAQASKAPVSAFRSLAISCSGMAGRRR